MIYDIVIVGAGAAGLFAASNIKLSEGQRGLIINKAQKPGLKLLMSGAGQCNLTHAGDIRNYMTHYGTNGKKIRSILYNFNNSDTCNWFRDNGLQLMTRCDGKVFPESMDAKDVLNVLINKAEHNGFEILNNISVTEIAPFVRDKSAVSGFEKERCAYADPYIENNEGFDVLAETLHGGNAVIRNYRCRTLIIACGGASYPVTGSDGSIFSVLRKAGIEIAEPHPSLVPLNVEGYPYTEISGNAVRDACVSVYDGKQRRKNSPSLTGDILFTHKNFSGPAVLDISRYVKTGMTMEINWIPEISPEIIYTELNGMRNGCKKKIITVLNEYLTKRGISDAMIRLICNRAGIAADMKFSDLSGESLKKFIWLLTEDRFVISGTAGYRAAMATAGGVKLSEIDMNTMQSKKHKGLYFVGEVTDIDGDTGGYNIQYAFSSAYRAAESIIHKFSCEDIV